MARMKGRFFLIPIVAAGLVLAGCGSGTEPAATTIAGIGVSTSGSPPRPSTPTACVRRWNGASNASRRRAARQRAPRADAALIQTARRTGYFREEAGRCLIWLITPPKTAVVFVEIAPGRFDSIADATGRFSANADLQQDGALHLR